METTEGVAAVIFLWAAFTALPALFYGIGMEAEKEITWSEVVFIGILCFPGIVFLAISGVLKVLFTAVWDLLDKPIRNSGNGKEN